MEAETTPGTTGAAVRSQSFGTVVLSWRKWWRDAVVGTVDQATVIAKRREDCAMSARYMFMIAMSAGIAVLGLLLSSPAVVIGAMLLSPLMGPIIGLGFAMAIGEFGWLRQSARSLAYGSIIAVLLCALIVFLSPLQTVTSEIAARTRPNLFDLLVALFSALAGAYAMIRGKEGTIVGVAIATALMPPLAVVGFGLATWNWTVFSGALLLYFTNLMTIALTAALMARLYGFRSTLSSRQTQFQNAVIVVAFVGLAVPLGYSLRQIGWEANVSRQIQGEVLDAFDGQARLSQFDINYDAEPIEASATVLTPQLRTDAERVASRGMERIAGRPVNFTITQYQVGTSKSAAEQAQLAAVQAQEQVATARADELAARLALLAGMSEDEVLVDRQRRRAVVRAKPLEGASLAAYADLERRIAVTEPEWRIELIPPVRALPRIEFEEGEPTADGVKAIALTAWTARRLGVPLLLTGPAEDIQRLRDLLAEQGAGDMRTEIRSGRVIAQWDNVASES
ncbi:DUF389 domain-containing protein [Allopontixanthobacter sediminis]|uniref:DUF389 domain-containing protein n=1 Tax=Allopontixanthobacter sediminis TaxID=1689985 RepID=A0A845B0W0_9SPHN|nr:DUF389 domain-containing protein [Allopontixanthobacter sediminis]MXP44921.1 DUF389 domain-containing protein [Allopontixanthobacter sediminis]